MNDPLNITVAYPRRRRLRAKSRTNQNGALDIRFVKSRSRLGIASHPARRSKSEQARVRRVCSYTINRRFKAAADRCGVDATAHSARVTYASAARRVHHRTDEVGRSQTERMVGHYASGVMVERNATAKYL